MKPYTTQATDQPHSNTHRQTPLDFTALWMRVVAAVGVALFCGWLMTLDKPDLIRQPANDVLRVVVVVAAVYAGVLAVYARLQHYTAYGRQERATKSGDTWRIHLKRELPVGNVGAVEMEPDTVDLPVEPSQFVNIVRQMQRTGTSRDKRPAGVSQPLWRKVMAALESLDGAVKGPNGYEFTDDLDALLRDIDQW